MPSSRHFLIIALLGIGLFAANLLVGKLGLIYGWNAWFHLEGVAEFLLLMASTICFVISTLLNEKASNDRDS